MKINKLLVNLFLCLLTIKSFSQTPMTIPDFSYRPPIIDGIYEGFLMQDGADEPFHMTLDLRMKSTDVTGTTSFSVGAINATFQIKGTYLRVKQWSGEENPNPEDLAFVANDIAVKRQNGVSILCKKEYKAKIEITSDSIIFYGTWKNEGRAMFENYKLVLNSTNDCYPGTFRVAKVKVQSNFKDKANSISNESPNKFIKGKDEKEFLTKMITFFANNKSINWHYKIYPQSLTYKVLSRDAEGIFTKVQAIYKQQTKSGEVFDDSTELVIFFDKGIPCRTSYPRDKFMYDLPADWKGDIGQLSFTNDELIVIKNFNDIADNKQDIALEKQSLSSLNKVIDKQNKLYGNKICTSCVFKSEESQSYTVTVNDEDLNGREFTREETRYNTIIKIKNNCNQKIVIVGIIKKHHIKNGIFYEDNSIEILPGKVFSFNLEINNFLGTIEDFSIDDINPMYDDAKMDVNHTQYLRIVCIK